MKLIWIFFVASLIRLCKSESRFPKSFILSTYMGNQNQEEGYNGVPYYQGTLIGPTGIWINSVNDMYITDSYSSQFSSRVRKVDGSTGLVKQFAGGGSNSYSYSNSIAATSMELSNPLAIWGNSMGSVYIVDDDKVYKVSTTGYITIFAGGGGANFGNGDGELAVLCYLHEPVGIAGDSNGVVYISDLNSATIRKVSINGYVSTYSGGNVGAAVDNVPRTSALFYAPTELAVDTNGDLFVGDSGYFVIRKISYTTGIVTTLSGPGDASRDINSIALSDKMPFTSTLIGAPSGLWADADGNLCWAEVDSCVVRCAYESYFSYVHIVGGQYLSCMNGDYNCDATSANFNIMSGIAGDSYGNLYVSDYGDWEVDLMSSQGIANWYVTIDGTIPPYGDTAALISGAFVESIFQISPYGAFIAGGVSSHTTSDTGAANGCEINAGSSSEYRYFVYASYNGVYTDMVNVSFAVTIGSVSALGLGAKYCSGDHTKNCTSLLACWSNGISVVYADESSNGEGFWLFDVTLFILDPSVIPTPLPSVKSTPSPSTKSSAPTTPTVIPTVLPTISPSFIPSMLPTLVPSASPTLIPTVVPTVVPTTGKPTIVPTAQPSPSPSLIPSIVPTLSPTVAPTIVPSVVPTAIPTNIPTTTPTMIPTVVPTISPSAYPTFQPSARPTSQPSRQPSVHPSSQPSGQPSSQPTCQPTVQPTLQPSSQPSMRPSGLPTTQPSRQPSSQPTSQPLTHPSAQPTCQPSTRPSSHPSTQPSRQPSAQPSCQPLGHPSSQPSDQPTAQPVDRPTCQPSYQPVVKPSSQPSSQPFGCPTLQPTSQPSRSPSRKPTGIPSNQPSSEPSSGPSKQPSAQPTAQPTTNPSSQPTRQPSSQPQRRPTGKPSTRPTEQPSSQPSTKPSCYPSLQPFRYPSGQPSNQPIVNPSVHPSMQPASVPSSQPTVSPSHQPSSQPSVIPSTDPSVQPTSQPFELPTSKPSSPPSMYPTAQPVAHPTAVPSGSPSDQPSSQPSQGPTFIPSSSPSCQPSRLPTGCPSRVPSSQPTRQPSSAPSAPPSIHPTSQPFSLPSFQPSAQPTSCPTTVPSMQPSSQPFIHPSSQPSQQPSRQPSRQPSGQPTSVPSMSTNSTLTATLPTNTSISVVGSHASFSINLPYFHIAPLFGYVLTDINLTIIESNQCSLLLGSTHNLNIALVDHVIGLELKGRSASLVPDINGDGFDDLLIGDPYNAKCYLIFGSSAGIVKASNGFTIFGEDLSDLTGWSVGSAGDVNNDTYNDIIIGAPYARGTGAVYVIYGRPNHNYDVYLKYLNVSRGFAVEGESGGDGFGLSVSGVGDVNADGIADVAVGAAMIASRGTGAVYVLFGKHAAQVDSANYLSESSGIKAVGPAFSYAGYSVSGAGDVNGDGIADVVIGSAPLKAAIPSVVYLMFGSKNLSVESPMNLDTSPLVMKVRVAGLLVVGVGDVNHDGFADVLAGDALGVVEPSSRIVIHTMSFKSIPTVRPSLIPSAAPSPTVRPSSLVPTRPTVMPTLQPTSPTSVPTRQPSHPTFDPTEPPTAPSVEPTYRPTLLPSTMPSSSFPSGSSMPSLQPSVTGGPTLVETDAPISRTTCSPSVVPSSGYLRSTRMPSRVPSAAPTNSTSTFSLVITKHGITSYSRTSRNIDFIVNVTHDVRIIHEGGCDLFTVYPRNGTTLTIDYFNVSCDRISLELFPDLLKFSDLNITAGSVYVNLDHGQRIHILNLEVAEFTEHNIILLSNVGSNSHKVNGASIAIKGAKYGAAGVVFMAVLYFLYRRASTAESLFLRDRKVSEIIVNLRTRHPEFNDHESQPDVRSILGDKRLFLIKFDVDKAGCILLGAPNEPSSLLVPSMEEPAAVDCLLPEILDLHDDLSSVESGKDTRQAYGEYFNSTRYDVNSIEESNELHQRRISLFDSISEVATEEGVDSGDFNSLQESSLSNDFSSPMNSEVDVSHNYHEASLFALTSMRSDSSSEDVESSDALSSVDDFSV